MKDFITKQIVNLKRSPQIIPLIIIVISCMVYTFNLTALSNAVFQFTTSIVALYMFGVTLFSILSIFSFLNVFKNGKCRPFMLIIELVLLGTQVFLNSEMRRIFLYELNERGVPMNEDIQSALGTMQAHIIVLIVCVASIALLPLYSWLIRKIKTNIVDDENVELDDRQLDFEDEEDEFVD